MRSLALSLLSLLVATGGFAVDWWQWGRNPRHDSASPAVGQRLERIEAEVIVDPFAQQEKNSVGGFLLVHYQAPIVDGNDLYLAVKGGQWTSNTTRETQTWNVHNVRLTGGTKQTRWTYASDWKPVPSGMNVGPRWEPVYHLLLTQDAVWAPGAGGTIDKIRRTDGTRIARFSPFGLGIDPQTYLTGPPTADDAGNIYYNAIRLQGNNPWGTDPSGSWLVKVAANGTTSMVAYSALTANAPAANDQCTSSFTIPQLPWPPSPDAVAPTVRCGAQRPGINVAPAVAADGTIYTVSRAHTNARWGFLIAVNPDLTPKWTSTLRNRFNDGCGVMIPPNGTPGGCRANAPIGVDPAENQPGSGQVSDDSTSSPAVTPDGRILYGAYTRYNYSQGHLMQFAADGSYLGAYGWGWDLTPAIYRHGGTYSILLKENHYPGGAYCAGNPEFCPSNRSANTPWSPEEYFLTSLTPSLQPEWKFRNTETESCERQPDGTVVCAPERPNGFEWCVNAIAVDARGVVYANAEDGYLYAINRDGSLRERIFLQVALGAAYTPLSIGSDGRIYTQNDGLLFVVGGTIEPRRRRSAGR